MPSPLGLPPWITNPGTSRWNTLPVYQPALTRLRKFSAATGEDSVNRPITMSPLSVWMRTPVPSPDGVSGGSAIGVASGGPSGLGVVLAAGPVLGAALVPAAGALGAALGSGAGLALGDWAEATGAASRPARVIAAMIGRRRDMVLLWISQAGGPAYGTGPAPPIVRLVDPTPGTDAWETVDRAIPSR
jgi:hypothetical protein